MLRKIFGLLIFPILGASVHTYAQEEYDQQIFQYINHYCPVKAGKSVFEIVET